MKTFIEFLWDNLGSFINYPFLKIGSSVISLYSIFTFIILLLLVVLLSRGVNFLCKKWLLTQLGLDLGNREAFSTLITYLVIVLGVLIVLQSIGIDFSALAVIVGGLGIGIGFGLQNLTKDFISGLILLFNREIKVDHFIQFGRRQDFSELLGTVIKINPLSTIVRTKDGGCVVVPNSFLVERPILNWSYEEEQPNRVKIPIFVNKNSDLVLVTEVILNAAYNESLVMSQPTSKLIFKEFKEYYWQFELQVWISTFRDEDLVKTQLNHAIQYHLRQHSIELIYPFEQFLQKIEKTSFMESSLETSQQIKATLSNLPSQPMSIRSLLPQIRYFDNFTELELRRLIELGYRERLNKGEILFNEGDEGDALYILLEGSVEVFVPQMNKQLAILKRGAFFGELSLLLGIPRTASVKALENSILFAIHSVKIKQLMQDYPELADVILQSLESHQEELTKRREELKALGLIDETENDYNIVGWIRKRFNELFD